MAYKIKPAQYYIPHVTAAFLAVAVGVIAYNSDTPPLDKLPKTYGLFPD